MLPNYATMTDCELQLQFYLWNIKHEALQVQRDHATCHKYEVLHLKRLAIGNDFQRHLRLSQLLLFDRPHTTITSCQWPVDTTSWSSTVYDIWYIATYNVTGRDCQRQLTRSNQCPTGRPHNDL